MKIEKRPITLLEIMIVIVIIGLIGGVTGYAMKGSLDNGRAFKSEQGSKQVHDLLALEIAKGKPVEIVTDWDSVIKSLRETGLVENPAKLAKDGWGEPFTIQLTGDVGEDGFIVTSNNWARHLKKKKNMTKEQMAEEFPWAFCETEE